VPLIFKINHASPSNKGFLLSLEYCADFEKYSTSLLSSDQKKSSEILESPSFFSESQDKISGPLLDPPPQKKPPKKSLDFPNTKDIPASFLLEWQTLQEQISYHNIQYYQKDCPEISDTAYDNLRNKLDALEAKYPTLKTRSISQKIGAPPQETFKKIQHLEPLYSLDNVFSPKEFTDFEQKIRNFLGLKAHSQDLPMEWIAEPKIDGLSVVLRYHKGQLVQGATRGDGLWGEDVTQNILTIPSIPKTLNHGMLSTNTRTPIPDILEIRGEVYISKKDFFLLNQQRKAEGLPPFANARNGAAGSLRQLDVSVTAKRPLAFLAHGFSGFGSWETYGQALDQLQQWGVPIPPKILCSTEEVFDQQKNIENQRETLAYEVDGMVYKLNRLDFQKRLGFSLRAPRFAIAFKFPAQQAITVVQDIFIQVGRTGVLTPVAILTPVSLGGVTVSRASLHNHEEILRKDIRIHDHVCVQRSGEVIPQITSVLKQNRSDPPPPVFVFPTHCPVCTSPLNRTPGQVAYRCSGGLNCSAQSLWRLRHFASKKALNITGIGKKHIEQLYHADLLRSPEDFFTLTQEKCQQIIHLEGWGEKSLENFLDSIKNSQKISLDRFIYALGIPQIGEGTAQVLAKHYVTKEHWLQALETLSSKDHLPETKENNIIIPAWEKNILEEIKGIGPLILEELYLFAKNPSFLTMVKTLSNLLDITSIKPKKTGFLSGKSVVFTGTLTRTSRAEAKKIAEEKGLQVHTGISSKVDYLVVGEKPGSKYTKAQQWNITILTEEEWYKILDQ
jgi:DNA ligase (NAD+)